MLPYWEGKSAEDSIQYIDDKVAELKKAFPGKKIVIAEVGWPSNGRTREAAVASDANEAMFLRRFLAHAKEQGYVYYLMEAFDQPWKAQSEGSVGAYWGVWNVDREDKFPFKAPIVRIPEWRTLAAIAVALALLLATVMVNIAPENPYLLNTLQIWNPGQFLNFNGLTRLISSLWPFLALPWLMIYRPTKHDTYY